VNSTEVSKKEIIIDEIMGKVIFICWMGLIAMTGVISMFALINYTEGLGYEIQGVIRILSVGLIFLGMAVCLIIPTKIFDKVGKIEEVEFLKGISTQHELVGLIAVWNENCLCLQDSNNIYENVEVRMSKGKSRFIEKSAVDYSIYRFKYRELKNVLLLNDTDFDESLYTFITKKMVIRPDDI
jgi:hypothetical protein